MKLSATLVQAFEYRSLEKLVKELYDQDIRILDTIPFERIGHYTYHEFDVNGESELDTVGDPEIVQKWIETGEITGLDMDDVEEFDWAYSGSVEVKHILHRLFKDGHIPAGDYIMLVDW